MERVVLVLVLAAVAALVAVAVQRRQRAPVPTNTTHHVPDRVARADFDRPEAPWLVAVFTATSCQTCAAVWSKARHLASETVVVQEVEVAAHRDVHRRYGIDAVPAVLVADASGTVKASFLGPVTATDLWASVAELREPGTLPTDGCTHGVPAIAEGPLD